MKSEFRVLEINITLIATVQSLVHKFMYVNIMPITHVDVTVTTKHG